MGCQVGATELILSYALVNRDQPISTPLDRVGRDSTIGYGYAPASADDSFATGEQTTALNPVSDTYAFSFDLTPGPCVYRQALWRSTPAGCSTGKMTLFIRLLASFLASLFYLYAPLSIYMALPCLYLDLEGMLSSEVEGWKLESQSYVCPIDCNAYIAGLRGGLRTKRELRGSPYR